ncbi:MAG: hypothetical protein SGJ18_02410 [Pseudomonadota bacterium]|nr:hypothetical protein [Pseudomonadota bacterium]
MKSRFKRRLLLVFSFVFAGAIAYGIFSLSPKTGKLTPQEYFCPACLEGFILKSTTFEVPKEIQFIEDSLFLYIPAQLDLAEKAMILSVLQNLSQMGVGNQSEFALLGTRLFEAWGKSRLNIKIRLAEHGIYHPQRGIQWPRINAWPFVYFSSLQTFTLQDETMAFVLIHPMQTEFDVFLSLAHQLFYLFDPVDYSTINNPHLQQTLRTFRALLVELHLYGIYKERFPNKKVSQYRARVFQKLLKKANKRDYAPLFEWVLEQLYPGDWTKELLTEEIKARVFLKPRPSEKYTDKSTDKSTQEESNEIISLGDLSIPYSLKEPVSFVGRVLPSFAARDSQITTSKFSELFSMNSTADGLLMELRPQNNTSADNSPALIRFSGIRKEIIEFMRTSLGESQTDDRTEIINSYIKGGVPHLLNFSAPLAEGVKPGLLEEF